MVEKIPIWLVWVWFREYTGKDVIWTPQLYSVDLEKLMATHHKKALENQFSGREDIRVEIEPREGTVYMTLKGYMSYWNIATGRWYRKGQADRYRMHRREKVQFT